MSKFFIERPIVAMVISLLTVIIGSVVIATLPVAQFPAIAPPEVQVTATYVGADAQTVEQSVATPIEQQMSGVDNMNYMYSVNATANGQMRLIVNFDIKTDPNTDLILAQSRETLAASQLPPEVTNYGVNVQKSVTSPLMLLAIRSPKGTRDARFLANYSYINLNDQLTRVPGIGSVQVFGAGQYAMRLWVRPDRLAKLGITVPEIVSALQTQNTVNPAGQVGSEPIPHGQEFTYSVRAQGRLSSPEEFEEIVIRETTDGGVVRVKDVARVELGAQDYSVSGRFDGNPSAVVAVYQLPGSNAVDTANGVKKLIEEQSKRLPQDVELLVALDTTRAVTEGIREIVETLVIALVLVIAVVYLFLQGWRATIIPLLAVPVSLIGTFILFPVFGFSINTLSMFAMVLAIGLVVDDAIVVVEAVERHIEDGLSPKDAARKAMEEITGPVIGIALVLSAVFGPTAFIPGITGRLYQQFAVTIAVSVILSAFNALTLSPALSALLLKPREESRGLPARFFAAFNRLFGRATESYVHWSGVLIRKSAIAMVALVVFATTGVFVGAKLPSSFVPDEDQGFIFLNLQLPNSASLQRTDAVMHKVEEILANTPGVDHSTTVLGFSLLSFARTSYNGFGWITLKEWSDRKDRAQQVQAIKARLNRELSKLPDGVAFSFSPPAIPGVGTSGGFTYLLEDRSGQDVSFLTANLNKFMAEARKRPEIANLTTTFLPAVPQQFVTVDRDKAIKQGVPLNDVYRTIQTFMGGLFVNYFNRFGRQWQVYVEAEGEYRTRPENVGLFHVRNANGEPVPLAALTKFESRTGPEFLVRFNEYRAAQLNGAAAPGYSSGQAMKALEETFAATMPPEMGYDYSGISFQEKKAAEGVSASAIFGFSLLFVFLILAALYESWSLPLSVLLSTPVAVFGGFGVLWLRRTILAALLPPYMLQIENDVYSQIGMVMLIGLAAKNAILIVEFAEAKSSLKDAPWSKRRWSTLRLRPILMTSFAFILGVVPLWTATGAGAISRQIMGTTVIGGMLAPFYWKTDASGNRLPYLDEIAFLIVPTEDAEVIRLQAGEIDVISRIGADNYETLARNQHAGDYKVNDLGPGLEYTFVFFNLNDLSSRQLPEIRQKQEWFRRPEFRQAVSAAIDRDAIVRLVYHGRATPLWDQVTPGNKLWVNAAIPQPPQSIDRATSLLRSAGFTRRPDGALVDAHGQLVEFSILSNPSNAQRTKIATIIQDDLTRLGMKVHVVPLEFQAVMARIFDSYDYEGAVLGLVSGDADPNPEINVWTSGGGTHVWALSETQPAADWQAEIDRLMRSQTALLDYRKRKQAYDRVQQLVAEFDPVICLASPHILVGARNALGGLQPAVMGDYMLWNADRLFWRPSVTGKR